MISHIIRIALDKLAGMEAAGTAGIQNDYRRRARRIRALYAGDPVRLQRSLQQLAAVQTRQTIAASSTGAAQAFADRVRDALEGPILRYSLRLALLRDADARGIGRFQANLIIAAVQHKADS